MPTATIAAYEWAILAANGYKVLTMVVTTTPTLTRELPYPGQVRWVRVRGQDAAGCLTHWSLRSELSWEGCYAGAPQVVGRPIPPAPFPKRPIPPSPFPAREGGAW